MIQFKNVFVLLFVFFSFTGICAQESVIDTILTRYRRPFTLMGMGQGAGQFVAKRVPVYPDSVFVILDETLGNKNEFSSQSNAIWLNHKLSFEEVQTFASCEHVDLLFLFDCLQPFCEKWKEVLHIFQHAAHVVVVALPKNNRDAMHTYLSQIPNREIYEDDSSIYYALENREPFRLIRTTYVHPRKRRWAYEIYCDYDRKFLKKIRPNWTAISPWFPGINMMTYLMLNGTIPSRAQVLSHLPLDPAHSDWVPNNMIVQGSHILLIDKDDPVSTPVAPDGGKRFRDMESKLRTFISTTADLSPPQVKEAFISIYNWGNYFDQIEIEE